jgi:hypothetical protein
LFREILTPLQQINKAFRKGRAGATIDLTWQANLITLASVSLTPENAQETAPDRA